MDVTKKTTTLYALNRDVFLFLVDDLNTIEAGLLPDGSLLDQARLCATRR